MSLKTKKDIEKIRESGRILSQVVGELRDLVKPGISSIELDKYAHDRIKELGGEPGFLGYEGYPNTLCASPNSMVVHGIPNNDKLKEGDIISLDLGVKKDGFYSDMAITVPVGKIDFETQRLLRVTKKSLKLAIKKLKIGNTIGDIGNTIERFVESQDFNVVRDLVGHGIGRNLHEEPSVPNYGKRNKGDKIEEGMVLCLEPMITIGDYRIKKSADGYGYETKDGSLCAHFEHTIAVTKNGPKVLTNID